MPLAIDGFDDDGTGVASLSVCVKSSALGAACDVHSATLDGGERAASFFTAEMLAAFFTAEMLASQDSAAFFVAVTAVDGMGLQGVRGRPTGNELVMELLLAAPAKAAPQARSGVALRVERSDWRAIG